MLFLAVLGLLSFLLLAPLLSTQHHLFLQRNRRMRSVVLLSSSAACGECGQSLYAASWKMCIPLKKWSAEKHVLVYSCSSLPCCTALKVWNAWCLILPGICIYSAEEKLTAAVIQGALKSKDTEDGSVCFLCSLGFVTESDSSVWPSTKDHLGTQR